MSKSTIIIIAVVVILIVGGAIYWYTTPQSPSYVALAPSAYQATSTSPSTAPTDPANAPATVTVTYSDSGFSPAKITVPQGGTVVFKNTASDGVWVASDPHPLHNGYPTTGGCVGSTFDSCKEIPPGGSWPFVFTYVGSWGYHNHLNPSERGTVVVQ
jgi:plastocyanin